MFSLIRASKSDAVIHRLLCQTKQNGEIRSQILKKIEQIRDMKVHFVSLDIEITVANKLWETAKEIFDTSDDEIENGKTMNGKCHFTFLCDWRLRCFINELLINTVKSIKEAVEEGVC